RNGARAIEGTFNIIDDTLDIIESNGLSPKELERLTQILNQAIERNTPAGKLREIIEHEVPKASLLNKFIKEGINLVSVLALIIAVLAWRFPVSPSPTEQPSKQEAPCIQPNDTKAVKPQKGKSKKSKVGVNSPCICGSGKKSKMCCGSKR
ncbi:MAG TPA: SEC-C metal-binding domain-containing protein, partial [Thermoanaerobaculia bacterium]|nr:SEC-C metal-binding domain-containing protein [Thermoanaerobaculia bacterium]